MKKFTEFAFLLIFTTVISISSFAQITIGTGTATDQELPVYPYFGYTYSQVIYYSSEIGASGDITTLSWYFAGSSLSNSNDWTIYIGHTTKTVFTSISDWVPVGSMTQVFSGTFADPGAAGWIQFDITDFTYNGTDNLVIAVDENASGYNGQNDNFYCTSVTGHRGMTYYSDGTNPDPASPPTGNYRDYIANIILGGITASCPVPTNQTEANITTSGADLGWTDASGTHWDLYIVTSGSPAPTTGSTPTVNNTQTNPYTWSAGNSDTDYDWYVRSDCGQDDTDVSAWVGSGTFTTLCAPITTFPALEDFETFTVSIYANGYENCWSTDPTGTNSKYRWNVDEGGTPSTGTGPLVDHTSGTSTGNYLFVEASNTSTTNEAYVYSPEYNLTSLTSPQIDFWYHMYGQSMGELHLDIDAGSGWVNDIMTALIGEQQSAQGDDWLQATVSLSAYTGQTVKFRFRSIRNNYQGDMAIDDVTVGEVPPCLVPSNQTESFITAFGADLSWTENGTAGYWDLYIVETGGAAPTSTTTPTVDDTGNNPHTWNGGNINTTYDWYVRADCGQNNTYASSWAGASVFTTGDVLPAPPLYQKEYNTGTGRPRGLCTADMDQDGDVDVIVAEREYSNPLAAGSEINIWMNNGTGMLLEPSPPFQTSALIADANLIAVDLNNDGFPDIVQGTHISNIYYESNFTVFINDGTGNLNPGTAYITSPNGVGKVDAADFDGDGFVDIVVSDSGTGIFIYTNNGSGSFSLTATYSAPFSSTYRTGIVCTADFNNDGWEDIILQGDIIFLNNGAGVFDSTVNIGGSSYNVCVADFDANGFVDVVTGYTIFWNEGNMVFTSEQLPSPPSGAGSAAIWADAGDINGDGLLDIVQAVNNSFRMIFYFNEGAPNYFSNVPEEYSMNSSISWFNQIDCGDLNNDGAEDAIISDDNGNSFEVFSIVPFVEHDVSASFADMPQIPSPSNLYQGDDIEPVVPFQNEIAPRLEIKNPGIHTESFNVTFQVLEGASIIYEEILPETLTSGETKMIDFSPWEAGDMGTQYEIKLFTDLAGDEFPDNDIITDIFTADSISVHSHSLPIQNAYSAGVMGTYYAKAMRLTPLAYPAQVTEMRYFLHIEDTDIPVTFCVWSDADPDNRDTFELENIIWSTTENVGPFYGWYVVEIPDSVIVQSEDVECYIGAGWPAIITGGADIFPLWKTSMRYAENRYGNAPGTDINNLTWGDSGYWPHICGIVKYFDNSSSSISLNLNAFLEGPFNETEMDTDLNPDFIPLSQPYNIAPWNYTGTENVESIPHANIVDWVLVELRDTTEAQYAYGSTMIARQAAFLLNDGAIVGLDGSSILSFNHSIIQSLFVVIWHRNHLGVLSANALSGSGDVYAYDFTTGADKVYGGADGHKEITTGIWGMIASDGNADGSINLLDKENVWTQQAGEKGYKSGDYNLNGQVNNPDKDDFWVPNNGSGSQVPE